MKYSIVLLVLTLVLLFVSGFDEVQTYASTPVTISTTPASNEMTGYLGTYGDWEGYAVDTYGHNLGDIPVTLHVMGINSNHISYEIFNVTKITNSSPPFVGQFNFDYVILNLSEESAPYIYVDAAARTADNQTMYGRTVNCTLLKHSTVSIGSVVLKATISSPIPSKTPMAENGMAMELVIVIIAIIIAAGGAYYLFKKK